MKFLNRNGELGNQIMSLLYIFLMLVIFIGLTAGIFIYFGAEYQFKQVDADLMYLKIVKCIREKPIDSIVNDFYSICGINKEVTQEFFRVKICLHKDETDNCIIEESSDKVKFVEGSDFQSCELIGVKDNTNFPRCAKGIIEVNKVQYEVIAGSRQELRRAG